MPREKKIISEYHLNQHQPDKSQFAIHDLGDYLKKHQGHTTAPHIHSYYQVIWFTNGNGKHFVDFKAYEVNPNSIFFVTKNQVHYFDDKLNYEGILIHFNDSFLGEKENAIDSLVKRNLFNNLYQSPFCCIDHDIKELLNNYILLIKRELAGDRRFGQKELLRAYLNAFLIQVQRKKDESEQTGNNKAFALDEKRNRLMHFMDLLDKHYNTALTVSEYANLMHMSTRTLSDLTAQQLNKTPSLMIKERIILEAQRLLFHSTLNVNQIGYHLGFEDPSYFVKYFKKHTGISPLEFRKSIA